LVKAQGSKKAPMMQLPGGPKSVKMDLDTIPGATDGHVAVVKTAPAERRAGNKQMTTIT